MAQPLFSRRLDCLYLLFFVIHIPTMFFVDFYSLYPERIRPSAITNLNQYYVSAFNDQFFIAPPRWFRWFIMMEAFYHVPLSLWAIRALLNDDPLVPLNLLVWSLQAGLTTLTCVAEISSWLTISSEQRTKLYQIYVPYLMLTTIMGLDMFRRLSKTIRMPVKLEKVL